MARLGRSYPVKPHYGDQFRLFRGSGATFKAAWARNANVLIDGESIMQKNTAGQKIGVQMVSATDGSAFTGAVTVSVTGDAGTQATGSVGSGACTHEGNGYHTYAPAQAETNYDLIAFTFTGTGAIPSTVQVYTSVDANVTKLLGTAWLTPTVAGTPDVNTKTITANAITATAINADAITDAKVAADVTIASVTGAVGSVTGAVGSVTGNVGGNVVGSTASVTAGVTVTTNNDKTGYGLSAAAVTAIWDALTAALTTVGSIGKLLVDNINATISSRLASASYTAPLDAAGTRAAVGLASANLDTQLTAIDDLLDTEVAAIKSDTAAILIDTAEIGVAGAGLTALATQSSVTTIDDFLDTEIAAIKAKTDNLPTDPADASDVAAAITAATSPLATAVNLATVAGYLDTEIAAILADTNELQTDWANGGRLDLILDARASQTSVDDIPTNAELATALGTADDATLAAIAALSIPTAATVADAVWDEAIAGHVAAGSTGEALSAAGAAGDPWTTALPGAYGAGTAGKLIGDNINATISSRASQTSVDDVPTNAELATALGTADDAVLAQVALVKAKTDLIPAAPAAVGDIPTATQNAAELLKTDMSAITGEASRSPLNALRFIRNKFSTSVTPGSVTVYKEDDTSVAYTKTLTTDASAEPIVEG